MPATTLRTAALLLPLLGACTAPSAPSDGTGRCSIAEPGRAAHLGSAAYTETTMQSADPSGIGSLALTVACATADPDTGDELMLIFPYLAGRVAPGSYRVVDPDGAEPGLLLLQARAFAFVRRLPRAPVAYVARAGTVEITAVDGPLIRGAYRLALTPEDSTREGRLVLGGAFAAPPFSP